MGQKPSRIGVAINVASIKVPELMEMVEDLNKRCQVCFAESRVKMLFAVKELDEKSLLWKRSVRIYCYTVRDDRSYRKIYNLFEFLSFHRALSQVLDAAEATPEAATEMPSTSAISNNEALMKMSIFQDSCSIDGLCIICFDEKPNVVLPCTHAYCDKCVGAFKGANQNSCPLCRHRLFATGSDCYVVVERPEKESLCTYMVNGVKGDDLAVLKCGE